MDNESGCFSIQLNESSRQFHQNKFIVCSSPLMPSRVLNNKHHTAGFSLKAKLKSKIFKKRMNTSAFSFDSFASKQPTQPQKQQQQQRPKEEIGSLVATFCKIMDKSLGWFRIKHKSKRINKQKKNFNKKPQNTFSLVKEELVEHVHFEQTTQNEYSQCNNLSICSSVFNTNNHLISTPIKPNRTNSSYAFKMPLPIISSPIQSQKFVQHSTPCGEYSRNTHVYESPICCQMSSFNSYSTSSSSSSCYSSKSFTRTRMIFGMTSSPNTTLNDDEERGQLNESSIYNNGLIETELNLSKNHTEFSSLDVKEKLLVEQLNLIKENVRINVELRDLKSNISKRNYNYVEQNDQELSREHVSMNNKKQKLQNIFQSKLQRQLNEVKKWQTSFRNKLNHKNNLSTSTKRSNLQPNQFVKLNYFHTSYDDSNQYCQCYDCQNVNNYF